MPAPMPAQMPTTPAGIAPAAGPRSPYIRVRAVLAAEWIKLRSLRSMLVTVALAALFCVGLAALVCSNYTANWNRFSTAKQAGFDPLDVDFGFVQIGTLFFGVLGALVVTNEYGNGLIRTTFAATPQRGLVLAAKTALLGLLALVASAGICLTAFFAGQSLLSAPVPHVRLSDPGVLGRVIGAVSYLTGVGLIGVFAGVLARSTAVAMSAVFGVFLVLPTMVNSLPHGAVWQHTVPYLPSNLGNALWHSHAGGLVSPVVAAFAFPVYLLALGAAGMLALRHRDA